MATTTTAQQNPDNHMKTLDEPSDPKPSAESVSPPDSAPDSPKSPPTDGAKEEIKAAGGDDSCQGNDIQKKMKRAERFGMPVKLSEEEKRSSRAERYFKSLHAILFVVYSLILADPEFKYQHI